MDYEISDFKTDVLDRSFELPVLVDFWAPWCGPCRVIGPVLEKLAGEAGDAWKLAKVNTDVQQEVSGQYGIRGIPAVKLFVDGVVVDEFTGALPEHAIRQWLEKALPSENRGLLEDAEALIEAGNQEEARKVLEVVLLAQPTNPQAAALLARLLVFDDPARALTLAETAMTAEPRHVLTAESVRSVASLLTDDDETGNLPDEPGRDAYLAGLAAMRDGHFDKAIEQFIEVLKVNRYFADDAARKAGVALFTLLGENHPATLAHRRTFDMWLY